MFYNIKKVVLFLKLVTLDNLKQALESECKVSIPRFHEDKMIINPDLLSLNQITLILHLYEVCKSTQRTCKAKVFSGNEEREVLTLIRLVFLRRFFSVGGGGGEKWGLI